MKNSACWPFVVCSITHGAIFRWNALCSTRCAEGARKLSELIFAPSAIRLPSASGEADPPWPPPCEEATARTTATATATSKSRQTRVRTRDHPNLRPKFPIIDDSPNKKVERQLRFYLKTHTTVNLFRTYETRFARRAGQNRERAATCER